MVIITLANQKGGCGKSTATLSIASALVKLGFRTCIVDTDPQCNVTDHLGLDREQHLAEGRATLAEMLIDGVPATEVVLDVPPPSSYAGNTVRPALIPGHRGIGMVERRLEAELDTRGRERSPLDVDERRDEHRRRLRQSLDSLEPHYDCVLIDTPPELGFLMTTALIAADLYIIPLFPSGYDLAGLESLMRSVEKIRARYNPGLELAGVLLGNFSAVARLDSDICTLLDQQFGPGVRFVQPIHTAVRHREAPLHHLTIFEHAPSLSPSEQYFQVAIELLARLGLTFKAEAQLAAVGEG